MPSNFPTPEPPQAFVEHRRQEVDRTREQESQFYKVHGEIEVNGIGEARADLVFPVLFVSKPVPSFIVELAPGMDAIEGNLPTYDVTVLSWDTAVRTDNSLIYAGAYIGIVSSGPDGQVLNVQWAMEGLGLRNPV